MEELLFEVLGYRDSHDFRRAVSWMYHCEPEYLIEEEFPGIDIPAVYAVTVVLRAAEVDYDLVNHWSYSFGEIETTH